MEKEKKTKATYSKIANLPFGKQRIITWVTYGAVIVLSVLASCYELIFDFEHFDGTKFATKLSISICIAIMGLLMSIKDGRTTNESKKTGDYAEMKAKFSSKVDQLVNKDWFRQWCDGVLYQREKKSAIMAVFNECGITEYEYLLVSDSDLKTLEAEPKECCVGIDAKGEPVRKPLDSVTKEQAKLIRMMRDKYRFKQLDYSYFTSLAAGTGYSYYANLKEHQRKRKIFALFYRVFMIIATTTILALAVINPHGDGAGQIAFDTTGRITTLLSSVFMGYTLANEEMMENIDAMVFKIEKIDEYLIEKESGAFVPISKDEEIRKRIEEIERRRAEEKRKAAAALIIPETISKKQDPPKIEYREVEMTEEQYAAFKER